jgi:diguanylate cyclase
LGSFRFFDGEPMTSTAVAASVTQLFRPFWQEERAMVGVHNTDVEMTSAVGVSVGPSDVIHRDLARHSAEQFHLALVPTVLGVVGVYLFLRSQVDAGPLLWWLLVAMVEIVRSILVNRVDFAWVQSDQPDTHFARRSLWSAAAFGLSWGSLSLVAAQWGTEQAMWTSVIVILGVSSLAVVGLAPFRAVYTVALAGLMMPLVVAIAISSIRPAFVALVVVYSVVALILHDALHNAVVGAVRAKHENGALATQLTSFLTDRDPLTGLLNRPGFLAELRQFAHRTSLQDSQVLIVVANVERLAAVNELLGVRAGDDLLIDVARRIDTAQTSALATARLGGDEFAIAVLLTDSKSVDRTVAQLVGDITKPYSISGVELDIAFHLAHSTGAAGECDALLAGSTNSLRRSRITHRSTFSMGDISQQDQRDMVDHLRLALERGEVIPWFQPIVDTQSGDLVSFEALVRWMHPTRGVLSPASFLPLAVATGLLPQLTGIVLSQSLRFVRLRLDRHPDSNVALHVNVLPSDLRRPHIVEQIVESLRAARVPSHLLVLEITEQDVLLLDEGLVANMHALHEIGVHLAIDDFGTGYSSLSHLLELPIKHIKIDRTFIRQLTERGQSEPLVRGVIGLASALGVATVAEGVERADQARRLATLGCTNVQGYLVSKALPFDEALGFAANDYPALIAPA